MSGANLYHANLSGAHLSGADLSRRKTARAAAMERQALGDAIKR